LARLRQKRRIRSPSAPVPPIAAITGAAANALKVVELDDSRGDRLQAIADSYTFLTTEEPGMSGGAVGDKVGVGVIGAGVISSQYLDNLTTFPTSTYGSSRTSTSPARRRRRPSTVSRHPDGRRTAG